MHILRIQLPLIFICPPYAAAKSYSVHLSHLSDIKDTKRLMIDNKEPFVKKCPQKFSK